MRGAYDRGTSGHTSASTSIERAIKNRNDGSDSDGFKRVLRLLRAAGPRGLTAVEMRTEQRWHGADAALTNLLKLKKISRLWEQRGDKRKAYVYVLNAFLGDRESNPWTPQGKKLLTREGIELAEGLAQWLEEGRPWMPQKTPHPGDADVASTLRYLIANSRTKKLEPRKKKVA